MHVQGFVLDLFQQRDAAFYRTLTMTTDQQAGLLAGSDRLALIHVFGEPLLGEPLLGHGLLIELDVRLCEEVVLGLITCVGEGLVSRPHLLGESAQRIYYLTSGKLKGRRNCLRIMMNERRKVKMMKKVKEVRENAQHMRAW